MISFHLRPFFCRKWLRIFWNSWHRVLFRLALSWKCFSAAFVLRDCYCFIYFILVRLHPTNGERALALKKISVEKHISQFCEQASGHKSDFRLKINTCLLHLLHSTSACLTFNDKTQAVSVDCILLLLHMSKPS